MHETLTTIAKATGFGRVFFLRPEKLTAWHEHSEATGVGKGLIYDIPEGYPWAKCVVLLVYPYAPFTPDERISAYYLASNAAYFAAVNALEAMNAAGARCERADIPMRALALSQGVGVQGRNCLMRLRPYGSRIVLQAFVTDACEPETYAPDADYACPPGCTACITACPANAIAPDNFDVSRCMRRHMNALPYPELVYRSMRTHMGCEICQYACPYNAVLEKAEVPAEAREAFALEKLLSGDTAAARALVGRNSTSNGKLTGEAAIFAARQGYHADKIKAALDSPFDGVREAAAWALAHMGERN